MKTILAAGGTCLLAILCILVAGCTTTPATSTAQTPTATLTAPTPEVIIPATTSSVAAATTGIEYATYTSPAYGLTLSYPKAWQAQESGELAMRDYGKTTTNIVNIFSPGTDTYVTFSVDVDPNQTSDLEQYYNSAVIAIQKTYPGLQLTKHSAQLKVSDNYAYRADYQYSHTDSVRKDYGFQVYTIVDKTPYIFTYQVQNLTPTDKTYANNLDEAQDIVKSVTITPFTLSQKSR